MTAEESPIYLQQYEDRYGQRQVPAATTAPVARQHSSNSGATRGTEQMMGNLKGALGDLVSTIYSITQNRRTKTLGNDLLLESLTNPGSVCSKQSNYLKPRLNYLMSSTFLRENKNRKYSPVIYSMRELLESSGRHFYLLALFKFL